MDLAENTLLEPEGVPLKPFRQAIPNNGQHKLLAGD